jgi:putative transposase
MPRRARQYIPELPYHIVQRGNNREVCFIEPENYQFYLELWQELSVKYQVAVHAYCLMTNHIHFLVTPAADDSISNTMKTIGSRYAQYINKKYKRTGTLWEGRHKSSLVQSERYLLTCYRYIELNPVRAGMVARPEEYQWSSYGANAWGDSSWLSAHHEYVCLGNDEVTRTEAYRQLFSHQLSNADIDDVRKSTHYCQPLGDKRFGEFIAQKYGIQAGRMQRGRPKVERDGD